MKKLSVLLLAGLMALSLGACGSHPSNNSENSEGGSGNNGPVTIEFFGWGDAAEQENYQTLVNLFMEENKNITVVYKAESSSTYMTTLRNRATNLPELFYMPDYDFLEWVSNGKLKDLSSYITEEELSELWPQAVDEYYYNPSASTLGKSSGAKLYGLPKDLGPFTLVYNKTLLDKQIAKYGLDSEAIYAKLSATEPMTWNEFRALLKQIDPDGGADNVYGISHYEIEAAVYSNNASFFNDDASREQITDPHFSEAIQFIADLTLKDHVMPTASDQVSTNGYQRFKGQGCVFSFMGPWDCAEFWKTVNFEYDILPVPYNGNNPDAESTAWVGSMGYCINKDASSAKTQAAVKLAKYLCYNEGAQRKFYELGQQVPNITSMANDEYINDTQELLKDKNPPSRSVWVDTINGRSDTDKIGGKVRSRYYTYSSDWYDSFTEYLTSVKMWDGNVTAEKACKDYAKTFQAALDEMRANLG
ncbi:MAG: extracellular solute-binding protein [Firmicutes bacterium]|nr:extracellular solute-binding protein [Bacillota bacterium]